MKKWQAMLKGHQFDLEDIYKNQQSTSWSIVKYEGKYYLESSMFTKADSTGNVTQKASDMLKLINGVARLRIQNFQPVELDNSFVQINDNDNRHHFVNISAIIETRSKVNSANITLIKSNGSIDWKSSEKVNTIDTTLAEKDKNVQDAIRIFGKKELKWSDLYKVFEIIRSDLGGHHQLLQKNFVQTKVISNFTHTAQFPEAIGDEARHARKKQKEVAPNEPMTIREAKSLISKLLSKWIESKQQMVGGN